MTGHEADFSEVDGEMIAECRCGFYRICENDAVAVAEFNNHLPVGVSEGRE